MRTSMYPLIRMPVVEVATFQVSLSAYTTVKSPAMLRCAPVGSLTLSRVYVYIADSRSVNMISYLVHHAMYYSNSLPPPGSWQSLTRQLSPTLALHTHLLSLTVLLSAADRSTAEKIKNDGNVLFKKGKFSAAVDLYTEALLHAPDMHVIYINRAMSYLKLERWEQCEQDARNALFIESGLIKVCGPCTFE